MMCGISVNGAQMKRVNDLGNDKMFPLILRLVIPSMLAQLVNVLYSIVDRIFISRMADGELALAGVGVCGPIVTLITSFSFLLGLGGAPLLAMKLGEGDKSTGEKILFNCFFALIVVAVTLAAFFLIFKKSLLFAFGASEDTIAYAEEYLTIYLFGSVFALLSVGLNNFITAQGFSKTAMGTVVIGAAINVALDPIFIFTFSMGTKGAAVATVIAQFFSCAWAVAFLILSKKADVRLRIQRLSAKIMGRVMKLGFSPFVIIATDSVLFIVLNSVLQRTGGADGDVFVAAATIVVSYMQMITMPMGGLTMACQPVVSFNFGARKSQRVKRAVLDALIVCLVFTVIMTVVSQFLPQYFVRIFSDDAAVSTVAVRGMRVYTAGIIILSVQYVAVDLLIALGVIGPATFLSMFRKIAIITLTAVLPLYLGSFAAFYAEPLIDTLSGILAGFVFCAVFFKTLRKHDAPLAAPSAEAFKEKRDDVKKGAEKA